MNTGVNIVADGFSRWARGQDSNMKNRGRTPNAPAAETSPGGFWNKIPTWFMSELDCLRRRNYREKSSAKILW